MNPRREIHISPQPDTSSVIDSSRLARAEASIVLLGLRLVSRWRRGLRYSYAPGYLIALNPSLVR